MGLAVVILISCGYAGPNSYVAGGTHQGSVRYGAL